MRLMKEAVNSCSFSENEVRSMVESVPFWGHSFDFPYNIRTRGVMDNHRFWEKAKISDLNGKRVLDVGTWDGFHSFEAERRGAQVVAVDSLNRMKKPNEIPFAGAGNLAFETARKILRSNVSFYQADVMNVDKLPESGFDIIFCLGLLYHLENPIAALEKLTKHCLRKINNSPRGTIYIETECFAQPAFFSSTLIYFQGDSFNEDPTNFFSFSKAALIDILKDLGYIQFEVLDRQLSLRRVFKNALLLNPFTHGRILLRASC